MEYVGKVRTWRRGQMTIPARLRKKLQIEDDTILSVYEMGRGILLVPGEDLIDRLSRRVREVAEREGVTLEDMLAALAEDRRGDLEPPYVAARRAAEADRLPGAERDTKRDEP